MGIFDGLLNAVQNSSLAQGIRSFVGADNSKKVVSGVNNILTVLTHPIATITGGFSTAKAEVATASAETLIAQGAVNTLSVVTLGNAAIGLNAAKAAGTLSTAVVKTVAASTAKKEAAIIVSGLAANLAMTNPAAASKVVSTVSDYGSAVIDPALATSIEHVVNGTATDTEYSQVKKALIVGGTILGAYLAYRGIANLPTLISAWETRQNTKAEDKNTIATSKTAGANNDNPTNNYIKDTSKDPVGSGTIVNVYYPQSAEIPISAPVGEQPTQTSTIVKKKTTTKKKSKKHAKKKAPKKKTIKKRKVYK